MMASAVTIYLARTFTEAANPHRTGPFAGTSLDGRRAGLGPLLFSQTYWTHLAGAPSAGDSWFRLQTSFACAEGLRRAPLLGGLAGELYFMRYMGVTISGAFAGLGGDHSGHLFGRINGSVAGGSLSGPGGAISGSGNPRLLGHLSSASPPPWPTSLRSSRSLRSSLPFFSRVFPTW